MKKTIINLLCFCVTLQSGSVLFAQQNSHNVIEQEIIQILNAKQGIEQPGHRKEIIALR